MRIKLINKRVEKQLEKYALVKKFTKASRLFESNPLHAGLNTEKLEQKSVGLYSFRVDKKYRAIFQIRGEEAEIIHITKHYRK